MTLFWLNRPNSQWMRTSSWSPSWKTWMPLSQQGDATSFHLLHQSNAGPWFNALPSRNGWSFVECRSNNWKKPPLATSTWVSRSGKQWSQSFETPTPLPTDQTMENNNFTMERTQDSSLDLFSILDGSPMAPVLPSDPSPVLSEAEYFHSGLWLFDRKEVSDSSPK